MTNIEILALAIANANQAQDPDSAAFKLCNPGLLTENGALRKFGSWIGGFRALADRLAVMRSQREQKLPDALAWFGTKNYGHGAETQFVIYDHLTRALGREVNQDTLLGEVL
jgi:hypothetical protein